jgi:hypothetical protein
MASNVKRGQDSSWTVAPPEEKFNVQIYINITAFIRILYIPHVSPDDGLLG